MKKLSLIMAVLMAIGLFAGCAQQENAEQLPGDEEAPAKEAVELTVADHAVGTAVEGLHPLRGQAHDGKAAKAHQTKRPFHHTLVVRPAHHGAQ